MPTRKFVTAFDEENGTWGFVPVGIAGADPAYGNGVSHDVLEHFPGEQNGLVDELLAFGALWWIRVDSGLYLKFYKPDPVWHLKTDLGDFFDDHGGRHMPQPPARALHPRHTGRLQFSEFRRLMDAGVEECINEHYSDVYEETEEWIRETFDETFRRRCAGWMMEGYLRAQRRYRGLDSYDVLQLFQRLGTQMERLYRTMNGSEPEGIEFTVSVFPKTNRIVIRGLEEWI